MRQNIAGGNRDLIQLWIVNLVFLGKTHSMPVLAQWQEHRAIETLVRVVGDYGCQDR